jgi:hypothetical protein
MSKTLLGQLHLAKHNGRQYFARLDESSCYCHTDYESIWRAGNDKAQKETAGEPEGD